MVAFLRRKKAASAGWQVSYGTLKPEGAFRCGEKGAPDDALLLVRVVDMWSGASAFHLKQKRHQRAGYAEHERHPFDLTDFGERPTEAVLMVKELE